MLETVFSEDFRGEQFPEFLQFLLEQFMYLETLFSYTLCDCDCEQLARLVAAGAQRLLVYTSIRPDIRSLRVGPTGERATAR